MGALCGAAIGVERQWSGHAQGHFAGVRTLTLLGGLSAIAGTLWNRGWEALAVTILAGAVALIVVAYAWAARRDIDATTEVASLIVVTAGMLAGIGSWRLASGIVVVTALLLIEKSRLHRWVESIPAEGLQASFRFALMAVVILPLLPEGPYGPNGSIRPRELWMLVLFFSGISFAAYVVRSMLGPARGYVWAGALGGLISSTNVTLTFSRLSRAETDAGPSLAMGVVAACTMLYLRVLAATAVLNPALARAMVPVAVAPAVIGAAFLWYGLRSAAAPQKAPDTSNPLQFRSALQMAALFQVVLFVVTAARDYFGQAGLWASGAVLGLTDVDALTLTMSRMGRDAELLPAAAVALGIGILSNTALKLTLAAGIGQGRFRLLASLGLVLLGVATAVPMLLL